MEGKKRKMKSMQSIIKVDDNDDSDNVEDKVYKFHVLLPNGLSVTFARRNPVKKYVTLEAFVENVKEKCHVLLREKTAGFSPKRDICWSSKELYLEDALGNKIRGDVRYDMFKPNKIHILKLFDGSGQTADSIENMWDLTPNTDLLTELPDDYTFETALADLIDNSLQAVWSNAEDERKLISVEIHDDRVSVFDTGPGMDGSEENSIAKWGKLGASLHRSSKQLAVGGKPPYLTPYFGMFGYGGTIASMHLGRFAEVSSKTRQSKKVYWLRLDRNSLIKRAGSSNSWKAPGGIRDPKDSEMKESRHGSFMKVEMAPNLKVPDIFQLQCKLKDIYFPYIQCDEIAGGTATLVEFQVNGINLAEIDGGEVAVTNLHSCNGPDFVLDVEFSTEENKAGTKCQSLKQANARLKCVYFPIVEGKENIERILEKLNADGFQMKEDFQTFSRISIRRLGRLLPDARWEPLPFMKPRQKRGEKLQVLRRCCPRVKCFIETDAGFNPLPSKTDLALHHPFTKALKDLGGDTLQKEKEVKAKIIKNGKQLSLSQLEREYQNWILQMHSNYDEEFNCGDDEPVLLINAQNKEALGITSDVVRIHETISRKGRSWSSGQKVKIQKGACFGCHKTIYAILEYFLLEGLQGDAGGEARIICRPHGVQAEDGCKLTNDASSTNLELYSSISLPITVIDSGKCFALTDDDWNCQVEKSNTKVSSTIELLGSKQCKALDIDGALPAGASICAGLIPPKELVAVLRPSNFCSRSVTDDVDQKYILKDNYDMCMNVTYKAQAAECSKVVLIFSATVTSTSRRGRHGLFIFPLESIPGLFQKAGLYSFSFSHNKSNSTNCEVSVQVKACSKIKCWKVLKDDQNFPFKLSAGSSCPAFSVARYDIYENCVPFTSIPDVSFRLMSDGIELSFINKVKLEISSDKLHMIVRNLRVTAGNLDKIRPSYEATLELSQPDKVPILSIPCQVVPGSPNSVSFHLMESGNGWLPKQVVQDFRLEIFDRHGNHVKEGTEVKLDVHGFCFLDQIGLNRKVEDDGFVDLNSVLKVTGAYGEPVSISVLSNGILLQSKKFQVEKRELRLATTVPEVCRVGSSLKDIAFEVVNPGGDVDETIHDDDKHGQSHMLRITLDSQEMNDSLRYAFRNGRCVIPSITLPNKEGDFFIEAVHCQISKLRFRFKVNVSKVADADYGNTSDLQALDEHDDGILQFSDDEITPDPIPTPTRKTSEMQEQKVAARRPQMTRNSESRFQTPEVKKTSQRSVGNSKVLQDVIGLKTAKVKGELQIQEATPTPTPIKKCDQNGHHEDDTLTTPVGKVVCADSVTPVHAAKLMGLEIQDIQDVEKDVFHFGALIKGLEEQIDYLEICRDEIEKKLQVTGCLTGKEIVAGRIENKVESAAAVWSIVSRGMPSKDQGSKFMADVVGLVALLGTAPTKKHSCLLAQYLGEEQMLAIVCRSAVAIANPEKYEVVLYSFAADLGKCIKGSHLCICLEDVRAYAGGIDEGDPQRKLAIPIPTLPDGTTPAGFLGYAVNLLDIDVCHLQTKTMAGHGLRETLFYRLFGELQVYDTKEHMRKAYSCRCTRDGAVSLDGGIMRGNGMISFGSKQLDVNFPVKTEDRQIVASLDTVEMTEELSLTVQAISHLKAERDEYLQQFQEGQAKYLALVEAKEASLSQFSSKTKLTPSQSSGL